MCHGKLVRERGYTVQVVEENEGFITLKKKTRRNTKNDSNKPRSTQKDKWAV
jgi:hypothetical protein